MTDSRVVQNEDLNPIQRVSVGDADYAVTVDADTRSLTTSNWDHALTHEGLTFYYSAISEGVADDGSIDFVIVNGAGEIGVEFEGSGGGDFYGYLYEAPDYGTDGSVVTPVNRNRNSPHMPDVVLIAGPTINNTGTVLISKYFPGGTVGRAVGVLGEEAREFIIKPETAYLARVTNKAGGAKTLGFLLAFHENLEV